MARRQPAAPAVEAGKVEAAVLRDCWLGQADDVVQLTPDVAEAAQAAGAVDLHASAVAAARTARVPGLATATDELED